MNNLDEQLIEKYFAGTCSDVEIETILNWLNESEENRREWMKLRLVSVRSNFTRFSEPAHLTHSFKEIEKEQAYRKKLEREITRKITLRLMQYAASVLLLIAASFFSYKYVHDWQHPRMVVVTLGENEPVRQIILSDSTRVWLAGNSKIEYPEKFSQKERNISIEGKAYFEVVKDAKCPFYVKTESYTVKVLGTSFEVNSFKDKPMSDVILITGAVEILDNNKNSMSLLQPGQQFEMNQSNNQFSLNKIDASLYTGWYDGKLEFDGQTLDDIAKVLERYYNVQIILGEGITREKQLVGSLSYQKDICEMMKTIELVVPIKFDIQTNTIVYIKSK